MDTDANPTPADHCTLTHRVFTSFGDPLFRQAETDGTPVMVVKLGDKEAAIPLRSLQREFGIPDDSDDGRMLGLIAQSLDFIAVSAHRRPAAARGAEWAGKLGARRGASADRQCAAAMAVGGLAELRHRRRCAEPGRRCAAAGGGRPGAPAAGAAGVREGGGGARAAVARGGDRAGRGAGAGTGLYRGAARPAAAPREGDGGEAEPHGADVSRRRLASRDADAGAAPDR